MATQQSGVDSKTVVQILKKFDEPIPIDFLAASTSSSSSQMRVKVEELKKINLVKIADDKVSLNREE